MREVPGILARFAPVLRVAPRRGRRVHPDVEFDVACRERAARGGQVVPVEDETQRRRRELRGIPVIGPGTGLPADERGDVLDEVLRRQRRGVRRRRMSS